LAVALKVVLAAPAEISTEAGTTRLAELEPKLTVVPVEELTATVHRLEPLGAKVEGLHPKLPIVIGLVTFTVPPVVVTGMAFPEDETPRPLATTIAAALLPERVTNTVAITPLGIVLAFIPDAIHTYAVAPPAQVTVLLADVKAAPAVTLKLATALEG
jgi:hypothetical protein